MTLTLDLGGHRDCQSYASWYFVTVASANFVVSSTWVRHTSQQLLNVPTVTTDFGRLAVSYFAPRFGMKSQPPLEMLQLCKLSNTGSKPTCLVLRTIVKHNTHLPPGDCPRLRFGHILRHCERWLYVLLSRTERLRASTLSICLFVCLSVCLSPKCKKSNFLKN